MGCTASKQVGRHSSWEQCPSPPVCTSAGTSEYSVEYHQHIVALTSSSYGRLKAMQPTESSDLNSCGTSRIGSLNEMYCKLISMEMNKSVDIQASQGPLHAPSGRDTFCTPALHSPVGRKMSFSPSSQCEWHFNSAEFVISETINVKELMKGFEEKVSPRDVWKTEHASSPNVGMLRPSQRDSQVSRQPKKRLDKPLHTVKEVDIVTKSDKLNQHGVDEGEYESGKENIASERVHHVRSAGGPLGSSPLSQISQSSLVLRDAQERASLSIVRPPGNSMSSSISEAKSKANKHGRSEPPHCTIQQQRRKFAASDVSLSMSMSRRMVSKENFMSTEPTSPLFDPNMVASYEQALQNISEENWNACLVDSPEVDSKRSLAPLRNGHRDVIARRRQSIMSQAEEGPKDVLDLFPIKCPPGGDETLVLYTTTLRGIRKTFEDCNIIRKTLQSYSLHIDERDVSMHLGFLNELRGLMDRVLAVPRLFIKGRYIGGVEEVGKLHEDGKLKELVEGLPREVNRGNCEGCDGIRFVPCLECRGSCKIRCEGKKVIRCPECNENGLIQCPICT
ncbi:hypothetical protein L7F22_015417 [Adiantum nelumboides]|nr:hypothetical protein [Adiantum nelumboides]